MDIFLPHNAAPRKSGTPTPKTKVTSPSNTATLGGVAVLVCVTTSFCKRSYDHRRVTPPLRPIAAEPQPKSLVGLSHKGGSRRKHWTVLELVVRVSAQCNPFAIHLKTFAPRVSENPWLCAARKAQAKTVRSRAPCVRKSPNSVARGCQIDFASCH